MGTFNFKLILLIGLFAALVIKGGQLCSADGVQAMTRLVDQKPAAEEPLPLRPVEEDFRGVSPLPALGERSSPVKKIVKPKSSASRKAAKPLPSAKDGKDPAKKPVKKG